MSDNAKNLDKQVSRDLADLHRKYPELRGGKISRKSKSRNQRLRNVLPASKNTKKSVRHAEETTGHVTSMDSSTLETGKDSSSAE